MGLWERRACSAWAGWGRRFCVALGAASVGAAPAWSATHSVGTFAELNSAISSAADGDVIEVTRDIVVTAQLSASNKRITIAGKNGQKRLLTVPSPGVNEDGSNRTGASAHRVFQVSDAAHLTLRDLHLKGGNIANSQGGGALLVTTTATLTMERVTISHSRNGNGRAGGLLNFGVVYMRDSQLMRNSATYGGGFVNRGAFMFVDRSTFSDNRSEGASGGGGAGENEPEDDGCGPSPRLPDEVGVSGGTRPYRSPQLFIHNSTFSNNKSTELGGAIKHRSNDGRSLASTLYIANSTFSGNVAYGDNRGGAIGINGTLAQAYIVNSVFAYNYSRSGGSSDDPTAYRLDDISGNGGSSTGRLWSYYNLFHDDGSYRNAGTVSQAQVGVVQYSAPADGSNDTIFSGGASAQLTNGSAQPIGTARVYQPLLVGHDGSVLPSLKSTSLLFNAAHAGVKVGAVLTLGSEALAFTADDLSWTHVLGTAGNTQSNWALTDQVGEPRQVNGRWVRGATSLPRDNVYQVKGSAQ